MRIVLALTFAACLAASPAWGQQTEVPKSSVPALLSKLHSTNWRERSDAVDAIRLNTEALHSREIQTALVDLLEQEYRELDEETGKTQAPNNQESNATGAEDDGEGYGEYLSWLAETVSSVADWNDTRQACLLVSAATVTYPPSPTEAAIRARAAMPCILKRATDHLPINREVAIPMLLEALAKGKDALDTKTVQNAKQIALNDLRDSDVGVRAGTVVALGNYGGIDMIPALQQIARSDPASEKTDSGGLWFPIRKSAVEAVAEIQQRAQDAN